VYAVCAEKKESLQLEDTHAWKEDLSADGLEIFESSDGFVFVTKEDKTTHSQVSSSLLSIYYLIP